MTLLVGLLVASNTSRDLRDLELETRTSMMPLATAYTNDALEAAGHITETQDLSLRSSQLCLEHAIEADSADIDNFNRQASCKETGRAVRELGGCRQPVGVLSPNAKERWGFAGHAEVDEVRDFGTLLPSRIIWSLHVGCDRSGFFMELREPEFLRHLSSDKFRRRLGYASALDQALRANGSELVIKGVKCVQEELNDLFETEANAIRRLAGSDEKGLLIAHGAQCGSGNTAVARLMIERAYAPDRDREVYSCARSAKQVWVPTQWAAEQFRSAGCVNSVLVVPEAVDPELFSPDAAASDASSTAAIEKLVGPKRVWRALCVAKWERRKGFDVLLDGIFMLDNMELLVHSYRPSWERGDPNLQRVADRARAKVCSTRRKCATVKWLGQAPLSRKLLRALYASVDAFVLTTRGEGWGLPVHEAMAMSRPVVVTNASGIKSLVGDNGILLPTRGVDEDGFAHGPAPSEVAAALDLLRSNSFAANELGKRARQHVVDNYAPHVVALKMRTALETLVQSSSSGIWLGT